MGAFFSSCHPFSAHDDDDAHRHRLPLDPETPGHRIRIPLSTATSSTRLTYDTMNQHNSQRADTGAPFFIRTCAKKVNAIFNGRKKGTPIELQQPRPSHCYAHDVDRDDDEEDTMFSVHDRSCLNERDYGADSENHLTWDMDDILHHEPNMTGARPGMKESSLRTHDPGHERRNRAQHPQPSHHVIEFPLLDPIANQQPIEGVTDAGTRSRLFPGSWFFSPKKVHGTRMLTGPIPESDDCGAKHTVIMTDMEWDDYGLEKL